MASASNSPVYLRTFDCLRIVRYDDARRLGIRGCRSGDVPVLCVVEGSCDISTVREGEVHAMRMIGDGGIRRIGLQIGTNWAEPCICTAHVGGGSVTIK